MVVLSSSWGGMIVEQLLAPGDGGSATHCTAALGWDGEWWWCWCWWPLSCIIIIIVECGRPACLAGLGRALVSYYSK